MPAKSLSTFTTELLTLHGQNDQLRLMRRDEQRAALDRFVDVESQLKRYRRVRDDWLDARRDLADRKQRARELAQEADRLKFGLNEIDTVAPRTRRGRRARRRHPPAVRTRRAARGRASGTRGAVRALTTMPSPDASAANGVGHAKSALEATDDSALRALAEQLAGALAVIADVSTELGDYLAELPSDASTLETKLARQGELRTLTRKYAADIDGVLQWAHESRERLAQLDVSEEALAELERRVDGARGRRSSAPQPNSPRRGPRPPRVSPRR